MACNLATLESQLWEDKGFKQTRGNSPLIGE